MDLARYRMLLAMIAVAIAVVSARAVRARPRARSGYVGLVAVLLLLGLLAFTVAP